MATPTCSRLQKKGRRPLPPCSVRHRTGRGDHARGVVRWKGRRCGPRFGLSRSRKNGTARKLVDGAYDDARHLAYFVGFAPASNPRVTAVVLINEPKGADAGGGLVAAPVFSRVVGGALRLLGVAPDLGTAPKLAKGVGQIAPGAAG